MDLKKARKLYDELLGEDADKNFDRVDRILTKLVIGQCDMIAEQINSYDDDMRIEWLLRYITESEIKEFAGKIR